MILASPVNMYASYCTSNQIQEEEREGDLIDPCGKQSNKIEQKFDAVISIDRFFLLQKCQEGNDKENQIITACAASDQQREISNEKQNLRILKWNNRFPVSANHECNQ